MEDILSAINCVEEYTKDVSESQLKADKLRLHATIYNVQIIGEAIYKLTKEFKEEHRETPWHLIEKMRHILVHDYFRINLEVLLYYKPVILRFAGDCGRGRPRSRGELDSYNRRYSFVKGAGGSLYF